MDQFGGNTGSEEHWTNYGGDHGIPYGPKLSSYYMHTKEWREAFLERLVDVGEPALFEAATRVFDLLSEPKSYYCALIAKAAGVSGAGKIAILNTLQAFLDDWLKPPPSLPSRCPGQTLEAWHADAVQVWSSEREREQWVVKKFAAALDGLALQTALPVNCRFS